VAYGGDWSDLKTEVADRGHKSLSRTTEKARVIRCCKAGLRAIQRRAVRHGFWWLCADTTLTLTSLEHEYAVPTDFCSFLGNSFRYGTRNLYFKRREWIDKYLGQNWSESTTGTTPRFFTLYGDQDGTPLQIAGVPSSGFVTANPTIRYQYVRQEKYVSIGDDDDSTELYLPTQWMDTAVAGALVALLQIEDDPDWKDFMSVFNDGVRDMVAGHSAVIEVDEQQEVPVWYD